MVGWCWIYKELKLLRLLHMGFLILYLYNRFVLNTVLELHLLCVHFMPTASAPCLVHILTQSLAPPIEYLICAKPCHLYFILIIYHYLMGLPRWPSGKGSACQCRRRGFDPWVGTIPCRRKWLPTTVFPTGKSYGQRSLAGYSPWGLKELDMTEQLS